MSATIAEFDAVVLRAPTSAVRVCGLSLDERARRVARKAGAARVATIDAGDGAALRGFVEAQPGRAIVVIDASDHVVHVPLVQTALTGGGAAVVVDEHGGFAGALIADAARAHEVVEAVDGAALAALATRWQAAGVPTRAHGELSRHPARTAAERRAAIHFLFGLIRKAQDSWLVRNVNRKVSYPFSRLLLPLAWLSPNMISICVFCIGAFGCFLITTPTYLSAVYGSALLLFAGYLDGCDGEIARIRLESSKLGAWIDTIADEVTTVLSVTCFGIHVWRTYDYPWLGWVVVVAAVLSAVAVLSVYYYLLTSGTGSGNSQDYPTTNPILNVLRYLIRREAINLGTFILCIAGLAVVLYGFLAVGAVVSSSVLVTQQVMAARARKAAAA